MKWAAGCCLLVVVLLGGGLVWCSTPPAEGSLVRVEYPAEEGAPTLTGVRVFWGVDKWAIETMAPGEQLVGYMAPGDGGGQATVLFYTDGTQHSWDGDIGKSRDGDKTRYGVRITLDPLGTVNETHCKHPCDASALTLYEQVRTLKHALGI
jgi:hypothetical protein